MLVAQISDTHNEPEGRLAYRRVDGLDGRLLN